jgi:hypothetical protein
MNYCNCGGRAAATVGFVIIIVVLSFSFQRTTGNNAVKDFFSFNQIENMLMSPWNPGIYSQNNGRFLVQATNNYGRYSNDRFALVSIAALAAATNRTLIYAPMTCEAGEVVADFLDTKSLESIVHMIPMPQDLSTLCGPHAGIPPPMFLHKEPMKFYGSIDRMPGNQKTMKWTFGGVMWQIAKPWESGINSSTVISLPHTCVGIHAAFGAIKFQEYEEKNYQNRILESLRASSKINQAVEKFLSTAGLAPNEIFVGVHMRLTDIAGLPGGRCTLDMDKLFSNVTLQLKTTNCTRVLLATDDLNSLCVDTFIAKFRPLIVKSGTFRPSSCKEAVFTQEVLGRAAGFIGSIHSSFSMSIEQIRTYRYKLKLPGVLLANIGGRIH